MTWQLCETNDIIVQGPTHHLEGSRLTTLTEGSHGKDNTSALIDLTNVVIIPSVHRGIWKLNAASVNVKNALQIGKACMEAYENKLPQAFCEKNN